MTFEKYHEAVVKEMHELAKIGVAKKAALLSTFTNSLILADIMGYYEDGASVSTACDLLIDMGA